MPNHRPPTAGPNADRSGASPAEQQRELIVVVDPTAQLRTVRGAPTSAAGADVAPLAAALRTAGATMRPVFPRAAALGARAAGPGMEAAADGEQPADLAAFYRIEAPDDRLDELAESLRTQPSVQAAYVKPPAEPADLRTRTTPQPRSYTSDAGDGGAAPLNDMLPAADEAPPATPDFIPRQGYLGAAPGGVDAFFAWTQPGGSGAGVRVIDIEGAWRFTHEDLLANQGGVAGGTPTADLGWRNHGTAVIGEIGGDRNAHGITGICPDAVVRAVSIFGGMGSAGAIVHAANLLSAGDILLIELHRAGPAASGAGQHGYIAIEWWPDDYAAIRYATGRGVIVVEAAGNGAQNLDAPIYDVRAAGFPADWSNPFRRGARDSGAILVGAGAPPPGTHGRNWGPDRSRLDFSNYGAAVDAQGWGREVTTTGYGDLQGGMNEDLWYTDQFSGTSSASPIVVGALGCAQGNRRARGLPLLSPQTARNLLRTTGTPQQASPAAPLSQRIGNRPDLRQMLTGGVALAVPLYRYWNPTNTDHFYTTNWNEIGWGRHGWGLEGVQCYVYQQPAAVTVRLFRYWNAAIGDHFYTTDWNELGAGAHGWAYEGVQCYVYPTPGPGRVPLYRYWNARIGDHFYTTNWGELGSGAHGWVFERIQCYVRTMAVPPAAPDASGSAEGLEPSAAPDFNTRPPGDGAEHSVPAVGPVTGFTPDFAAGGAGGAMTGGAAGGVTIPDSFRTEPVGGTSGGAAGQHAGSRAEGRAGDVSFTITVRAGGSATG